MLDSTARPDENERIAIMNIAERAVSIKKILFFRCMQLVLQFDENILQNVTISLIFFQNQCSLPFSGTK